MALVDFIDGIVGKFHTWAQEPDTRHWWGMFRLAAVLIDSIVEGVYQGRRAGMPDAIDLPGVPGYGGFEDVASLDRIGHDLGVLHGLTEAPPAYALRLRQSQVAGAGGWPAPPLVGLFEQLAGVLGPHPPLMRIVDRHRNWWTREQSGRYTYVNASATGLRYELDGTVTPQPFTAAFWDWDTAANPPSPTQGELGDWFLIVYKPVNLPYGTTNDGTFADPGICGDLWNNPNVQGPDPGPWAGCVGTNLPACLVSLILGVIAQRQCASFNCLFVIIAFDPDSFDPYGLSPAPPLGTAYPDGNYAWHTKYDPGTNTQIIARNSTAEYIYCQNL